MINELLNLKDKDINFIYEYYENIKNNEDKKMFSYESYMYFNDDIIHELENISIDYHNNIVLFKKAYSDIYDNQIITDDCFVKLVHNFYDYYCHDYSFDYNLKDFRKLFAAFLICSFIDDKDDSALLKFLIFVYRTSYDSDNYEIIKDTINDTNIYRSFIMICIFTFKKDLNIFLFENIDKNIISLIDFIKQNYKKIDKDLIEYFLSVYFELLEGKNYSEMFINNIEKRDLEILDNFLLNQVSIIDSDERNKIVASYIFRVKRYRNKKGEYVNSIKDNICLDKYSEHFDERIKNNSNNISYSSIISISNNKASIDKYKKEFKYKNQYAISDAYMFVLYLTCNSIYYSNDIKNKSYPNCVFLDEVFKEYEGKFSNDDANKITNLLLKKEFFSTRKKIKLYINSFIWNLLDDSVDKHTIQFLYDKFDEVYIENNNKYDNITNGAKFTKAFKATSNMAKNDDSSSSLFSRLCKIKYFDSEEKVNDFIERFKNDINGQDKKDIETSYMLCKLYKNIKDNNLLEKYYLRPFVFDSSSYSKAKRCLINNGYFDTVKKCDDFIEIMKIKEKINETSTNPIISIRNSLIDEKQKLSNSNLFIDCDIDDKIPSCIYEDYDNKNLIEDIDIDKIDKIDKIYRLIIDNINSRNHNLVARILYYAVNSETVCNELINRIFIYHDNSQSIGAKQYEDYIAKVLFKFNENKRINKHNILNYIGLCTIVGMVHEIDVSEYDYCKLYEKEFNKEKPNINTLLYLGSKIDSVLSEILNISNDACRIARREVVIYYFVNILKENRIIPMSIAMKYYNKFRRALGRDMSFDTYNLQHGTNTSLFYLYSIDDIDNYLHYFCSYDGICNYKDLFTRFLKTSKKSIYIYDCVKGENNVTRKGYILYFIESVMGLDRNIKINKKQFNRMVTKYNDKIEGPSLYEDLGSILLEKELDVLNITYNITSGKSNEIFSDSYFDVLPELFTNLYEFILKNCCNNDDKIYSQLCSKIRETSRYKECVGYINKMLTENEEYGFSSRKDEKSIKRNEMWKDIISHSLIDNYEI